MSTISNRKWNTKGYYMSLLYIMICQHRHAGRPYMTTKESKLRDLQGPASNSNRNISLLCPTWLTCTCRKTTPTKMWRNKWHVSKSWPLITTTPHTWGGGTLSLHVSSNSICMCISNIINIQSIMMASTAQTFHALKASIKIRTPGVTFAIPNDSRWASCPQGNSCFHQCTEERPLHWACRADAGKPSPCSSPPPTSPFAR